MKKKIIVGIDEVGRGPLAGPVSVGIAVLRQGETLPFRVTDSKQMTEKAREAAYGLAEALVRQGDLQFGVYSVSAKVIDEWGISRAIAHAIARGLKSLALDPREVELQLDGGLRAPDVFLQETIVRGDALVPSISLASVVAKVERDRYMAGYAHRTYPAFGFNAHKGYGTAAHYRAIRRHGLTPLHRRSFLKKIVVA